MAGARDQLARLLALVPWLQAHPGVTKTEAAAAFDISVAQLERDLRLAFTCELPGRPEACLDIDYLDSDRITVIDPQTIDRPLRLVPEEAVALIVGLRSLAGVPGLQDRAALDSALAKLEDAAAAAGGVPTGTAGPTHAAAAAQPDAVAAVRSALELGRRLHLSYWVPSRDELTERDVDPLRAVSVEGVGYLEGWCHASEAVRTFRLDRVVRAEVLDAPSTPPADAAPQPDAGAFHPAPDDLLVTVDLTPRARWVPEYYPCESVTERPDGGLRVTVRTADARFVQRLVLRLGGDGAVVQPAEVAAGVLAEARNALAAYGVSC